MKYSEGFRNSVLRKVLPPNEQSIASVSREYGVTPVTIYNWLTRLKAGTLELPHGSSEPAPSERSVKEKYRILLESKSVMEEDLGEWLRQQGLHSEHLSLWEQELEDAMTDGQQRLRRENTELRKENQKLKKQARRDKAAMAEALALLTLKKSRCLVGSGRGGLNSASVRQTMVQLIDEAHVAGARIHKACEVLAISYRSYRRWKMGELIDGRKAAVKHIPRRLSEKERQAFYNAANSLEYRDYTPAQVVASLLDKGVYLGSERTLYRILKERSALVSRTETRKRVSHKRPSELVATGTNQIWTWDITWLKTDVKGRFLYAYVITDIFSRMIVGWSVEESESAEYARDLFERTIRRQGVRPRFVHSDNGHPMRGVTLVALLSMLDVKLSFSRPGVSDDNPFIESFFGTVKTHVKYPGFFRGLKEAREWWADFIDGYNTKHKHSGIEYVTPLQKHTGVDVSILRARGKVLSEALRRHPERFVRGSRVALNDRTVYLNKQKIA